MGYVSLGGPFAFDGWLLQLWWNLRPSNTRRTSRTWAWSRDIGWCQCRHPGFQRLWLQLGLLLLLRWHWNWLRVGRLRLLDFALFWRSLFQTILTMKSNQTSRFRSLWPRCLERRWIWRLETYSSLWSSLRLRVFILLIVSTRNLWERITFWMIKSQQ